MAYTKTTWATGDTITAEKMNKMEQGIYDAQLPAATAADEGDVLSVDSSGNWVKSEPSGGGGGVLNVGFSVSFADPSNPVYSCDTSFADIAAAYASNTQVIATMDSWKAIYYSFDDSSNTFSVTFVQFSGGYMYVYEVSMAVVEGTDVVTGTYTAYTLTPAQ